VIELVSMRIRRVLRSFQVIYDRIPEPPQSEQARYETTFPMSSLLKNRECE